MHRALENSQVLSKAASTSLQRSCKGLKMHRGLSYVHVNLHKTERGLEPPKEELVMVTQAQLLLSPV